MALQLLVDLCWSLATAFAKTLLHGVYLSDLSLISLTLINQKVDEKCLFIETFKLTNENKVIELEYHYCATPNELTEKEQLIISQ